ncbi:MAG: hypothetical protein AAGL49_06815, partial [Pseudomonadota bacterium]
VEAHNTEHPGSSTRIGRAAFLPRPPDLGRGEITDKGYINQRAMLASWAELIDRLYDGRQGEDEAFGFLRF